MRWREKNKRYNIQEKNRMVLYTIIALSIILFVFLTGLCVQLIRIEKSITDISLFVEGKVSSLIRASGK